MVDNKPLTDGRIPPHTVCPYKSMCIIDEYGYCQHTGLKHKTTYTCLIMEDVAASRDNLTQEEM